ncbi:MAG: cyclic beta 1-2 glucan synthetase, partial [Verrucomicrobia bacterium]|nr:cyclic beta 1-2 glucan synthetase [Verrucomicrobiota bacterium]
MRTFNTPALRAPQVHLLSNGRYHVVITNAGGGYSRWRHLAVTRWREDAARDCWGTFIYLRDAATKEFWSAAYQPVLQPAERYEVSFARGSAAFRQHRGDLEVHTQICVSPEDDVELRRVTLTNHSRAARSIELTSYAEVVLAVPGADLAHPVFSNLFVQTEFVRPTPAILCTRRPRSEGETAPWLLHLMVGDHSAQDAISCETDRARFVGRGRTPASPAAMHDVSSALSNTAGSVLDPIVSLRRTFGLAPNETVRVDFVLGVTESRDTALALAENYLDARTGDRAFVLARNRDQVTESQLNATESELETYERLAGPLIYADPARRASPGVLLRNRQGQSALWRYGISGDLPIVLLRIDDPTKTGLVTQFIGAHAYWRMNGLAADLVILIGDVPASDPSLQDQLVQLIASGPEAEMRDKPGGIFVRGLAEIPEPDRVLLQSAARLVVTDEDGLPAERGEIPEGPDLSIPALTPVRTPSGGAPRPLVPRELIFPNGLGGFTPDGREYVITLEPDRVTPAPWVNVLANPGFGTVISEGGSAYTWAENSHEFRLTPWNNDPVTDAGGEAFYIRDEQSGEFWSPSPLPARGATTYVIRHGFGYSVFEHTENGIVSELTVYVAIDAPVKIAALKLRNVSGRPRRISITGYWEWVLGDLRQKNLLHVQTEVDPGTGALLARNYYSTDFSEWIAFIDADGPARTVTGNRNEFLGRNGTLSEPAALKRVHLSGQVGAGLDPCGAIQVSLDLPDGQELTTGFRLGAARGLKNAQSLIHRFRGVESGTAALEGVRRYWTQTL